jgi:hypothetical protein
MVGIVTAGAGTERSGAEAAVLGELAADGPGSEKPVAEKPIADVSATDEPLAGAAIEAAPLFTGFSVPRESSVNASPEGTMGFVMTGWFNRPQK